MFLRRQEDVPRRSAAGTQKAGGHFPAQGIQDAPEKRQDHGRDGQDDQYVAAFRVQCFLRQPDIAKRRYGHGESGALHHPSFFLAGTDEVYGTRRRRRLSRQKRQGPKDIPRSGMVGGHVLPYPKPWRADGEVLRLLQQCRPWKKERGGHRRCHPLHPRTTGKFKGIP